MAYAVAQVRLGQLRREGMPVAQPGSEHWDDWVAAYEKSKTITHQAVESARVFLAETADEDGGDEHWGAAAVAQTMMDLPPTTLASVLAAAVFELARSVTAKDVAL